MEQRNLFSPGTTDIAPDIAPRADLLACLAAATRRPEACVKGRGGGIPSAVLVPLVDHVPGFTILLTRRAGHLANHRGQVCFPGGRVEAHDDGPVATALRETFEEVGLPSAAVTVIGCLDDYATLTGFMITPVVGVVAPPLLLRIAPEEVETAFEMPLSFLLDPVHHRRLTPVHSRIVRTTYAIPWQGHYVWGATAAMLMNLYRIIGRMRTER